MFIIIIIIIIIFITWSCNYYDDDGFNYLAKITSEVAHYDSCLLLCLRNTI